MVPSYSPDLNPIEEAFSKVKARLRKAAARTREALVEAMGEALCAIMPRDVQGWFAHCAYGIRKANLHEHRCQTFPESLLTNQLLLIYTYIEYI